jgi:hypothetical protein
MPRAEILATTVTTNDAGAIVQLQISDASLESESFGVRLILTVQLPSYRLPFLAQIEREAMRVADKALDALCREREQELNAVVPSLSNLSPALKK